MKPKHDVTDKVYYYMASSGVVSGTIEKMSRSVENPHTWECVVKFYDIDKIGLTHIRCDETELFKTLDDLKQATLKKITDRFETEKKSLIEDIEMYNE